MAIIDKLSAIGDAIRAKTGKTAIMTLDEMPAEIASIQTGGGSSSQTDSSKGVYGIGDRMMDTAYHCTYDGQTFCKVSSDTPDLDTVYPNYQVLAVRYIYDEMEGRYVTVNRYVYCSSIDIGYSFYSETEAKMVGFVCTDDGVCLGRGVYLECLGDGYGMGEDHQGTLAIMQIPEGIRG